MDQSKQTEEGDISHSDFTETTDSNRNNFKRVLGHEERTSDQLELRLVSEAGADLLRQ